MRVLSFIPAFLLAAASFVAAAPANTPVDTSCVSSPAGAGGAGNDAALQPVIAIIANATTYIQPLSVELANLKGDSCTPDAVANIVVEIKAVVSLCVAQLKAVAEVDLTGLYLGNLCATIYAHLTVILEVFNVLVAICISLQAGAVVTIKGVICGLLDVVVDLLGCLNIYVVASVTGVLGPVIICVKAAIEVFLSIVLKADVFLGAH